MKLNPNIAYNKITDDEIKVLKLDEDNNVYTLEKSVANVFELIAKGESEDAIKSSLQKQHSNLSKDQIETFCSDTFKQFKELGFLE